MPPAPAMTMGGGTMLLTYPAVVWITMARSTVRPADRPRETHPCQEDDVNERRPATPAPEPGPRPDDTGAPPPEVGLPPDAERRPIGALLIVGFLTLTILVSWYGMFALNVVRN
jgi:hypothetical protein